MQTKPGKSFFFPEELRRGKHINSLLELRLGWAIGCLDGTNSNRVDCWIRWLVNDFDGLFL